MNLILNVFFRIKHKVVKTLNNINKQRITYITLINSVIQIVLKILYTIIHKNINVYKVAQINMRCKIIIIFVIIHVYISNYLIKNLVLKSVNNFII